MRDFSSRKGLEGCVRKERIDCLISRMHVLLEKGREYA